MERKTRYGKKKLVVFPWFGLQRIRNEKKISCLSTFLFHSFFSFQTQMGRLQILGIGDLSFMLFPFPPISHNFMRTKPSPFLPLLFFSFPRPSHLFKHSVRVRLMLTPWGWVGYMFGAEHRKFLTPPMVSNVRTTPFHATLAITRHVASCEWQMCVGNSMWDHTSTTHNSPHCPYLLVAWPTFPFFWKLPPVLDPRTKMEIYLIKSRSEVKV